MKKYLTCAIFIAAIAIFLDLVYNLPLPLKQAKLQDISIASGKILLVTVLLIAGIVLRRFLRPNAS